MSVILRLLRRNCDVVSKHGIWAKQATFVSTSRATLSTLSHENNYGDSELSDDVNLIDMMMMDGELDALDENVMSGLPMNSLVDEVAAKKMLHTYKHWAHSEKTQLTLVQREEVAKQRIPLAVKRGPPSLPHQLNEIDSKEDIWIVRRPKPFVYDWEPPTTDTSIVDTQLFSNYHQLLNYLLDDKIVSDVLTARKENAAFLGSWERVGVIKDIARHGLNEDIELVRLKEDQFVSFAEDLLAAVQSGWENGDGGRASTMFILAAREVCYSHAYTLNQDGCRRTVTKQLGGTSQENVRNGKYVVRRANPNVFDSLGDDTNGLESALRERNQWVNMKSPEDESELQKDWAYWTNRSVIPDAFFMAWSLVEEDDQFGICVDGLLLAEVKSESIGEREETQAYLQALQGLAYRSSTASLVMAPREAVFQNISAENGFLDTKKKKYSGYDQFHTLFSDLVLYFWNTYYCK